MGSLTDHECAAAEDVRATVWTTATFAPRTDIADLEHLGGVSDAECMPAIKVRRLNCAGANLSPLNTASRAGLIECVGINPSARWHGRLQFNLSARSGGVPELMVYIKSRDISENQLTRFEDEI